MKNPFSFTNKGGKTRFGNIRIQIPITENGDFDMGAQKEISAQFELVEQLKSETRKMREKMRSTAVTVDLSSYSMVYKPLTELFTIVRGSGKYTKAYTKSHSGVYPLYSGNTFGEFAFVDKYDYDTPCLTWAIDGLAGYMIVHKSPFSATNHRGILFPKIENVDIDYIKFYLEPIFRQVKKGRIGDNGENEYTSLPPFMLKNIKIALPVDENGEISLDFQHEIASSYLAVEQYRRKILEKLDVLWAQKIAY